MTMPGIAIQRMFSILEFTEIDRRAWNTWCDWLKINGIAGRHVSWEEVDDFLGSKGWL